MKKIVSLLFLIVFFLFIITGSINAEPKFIAKENLKSAMQAFSKALGVKCYFCHVGDKSITIENLGKYDATKDLMPMKNKSVARGMLGMQTMFNAYHKTSSNCMGCHQGRNVPSKK